MSTTWTRRHAPASSSSEPPAATSTTSTSSSATTRDHEVVAFTATQIPDIDGRRYPPELAATLYPQGIPIVAEDELTDLIEREQRRRRRLRLLGRAPRAGHARGVAMHRSGCGLPAAQRADAPCCAARRPVVAVTAVRTGVGKSQTTRYLSRMLRDLGQRVVAIRHPMPYGDLAAQACQRFATYADLDRHECTIEEREEYEPHIDAGVVVYAGVDYEQILRAAEQEADVILWDGGNNDLPFYVPDLHIVLADPLRAGRRGRLPPGRGQPADGATSSSSPSATALDRRTSRRSRRTVRRLNPRRHGASRRQPCDRRRRRRSWRASGVIVVEDGPTLTHGSMSYGAAVVGARAAGAAEIVDPSPVCRRVHRRTTYAKYPNARGVLPAMGYGEAQVRDLEATIEATIAATGADAVVSGTPIDLGRILSVSKPLVRARYELREHTPGGLEAAVREVLSRPLTVGSQTEVATH